VLGVRFLMKIRVKKQNSDGIVRLETSGQVKEVLLKEDFLKPDNASVHVCFKGKDSSGIVELSPHEARELFRESMPKLKILEGVKVMRFDK